MNKKTDRELIQIAQDAQYDMFQSDSGLFHSLFTLRICNSGNSIAAQFKFLWNDMPFDDGSTPSHITLTISKRSLSRLNRNSLVKLLVREVKKIERERG